VSVKGRARHAASSVSNSPARCETRLFEKLVPHSTSVISLTFRVETPSRYISINASTSAFSLR
jgi:hypothetical protein